MAQRVESKRRVSREPGLPGWAWGALGLVIGLAVGLFYAWSIAPVTYSNYLPSDLSDNGKRIWVEMAADSFALEGDPSLAQFRLQFFGQDELRSLLDIAKTNTQGNLAKLERLEALEREIGTTVTGSGVTGGTTPGSATPDSGFPWLTSLGLFVVALALLAGGAVLFTRMQQSRAIEPRREGARRTASTRTAATLGPPPASTGRQDIDTPPQAQTAYADDESDDFLFPPATTTEEEEDADEMLSQLFEETRDDVDDATAVATDTPRREFEFAEPPAEAPSYSAALDQFLARYNYGDDGYDMSFSIETPQTEFLGECGVGICEVLGAGSPQKVTAFEVWLFDKDDIRTVTKVLLSDYAAASDELRGRLSPKGELVPIKSGDTIDLETKSLRVRARVRELEYGKEGTPRSYYERFVVELTPQQKV